MPEHLPPLRVIVVGSSAGGLEALTKLLGAAKPGMGWCFVLAQHLSPSDDSVLVQLLGRTTGLKVIEATDRAELLRDVVYVAPPGVDIVVEAGCVRLLDPDDTRRPWPSIDRLLTSAAQVWGPDAVGVVLSGTGHDGAAGAESIGGAGGTVVVQDQATAAYGAMPGAAVATGSVDLQLPPQDIPAVLERIVAADPVDADHDAGIEGTNPNAVLGLDDTAVEAIVASLRTATGVDYSGYKASTIRRQVERRLRILDLSPADYLARLTDPVEAETLSRGILVSVTSFFRDGPVWVALAGHVAALVIALEPKTQFRVWVPGCATGEEAFTLAMLAAEALGAKQGDRDLSTRIKVFATDLDERALASARRARYSDDAVASVPPDLRERWMRRVDGEWEIVPSLRECLVIARHNVAFDPPFPRIHVISLRNTMIYFQPHLQERVLQLCQFALVPDGLLILGQSERVPTTEALFTVAEPGHRIYRRRATAGSTALPSSRYVAPVRTAPAPATVGVRGGDSGAVLYRRLLRILAPPSLVLDENDGVIEVIGDVSPWCTLAEGRHTGHVADLLRAPYRVFVRTMLSQLRHSALDTVVREVIVAGVPVELSASRVVGDGVAAVVSFRGPPTSRGEPDEAPVSDDATVFEVTAALASAEDALQATVEDLSSSNEELQALNEELQASTEELQATSEEAQASNEELEAANEELTTVNQELQARGAELLKINTDLENIQASITSGLVMVDRDLRVLRYSPLAVRLFSLIHEDIGRPLSAIPTTIPVPTLVEDLHAAMASRTARFTELSNHTRDLLLQTQPYIGSAGDVLGAIVVVLDVSDVADARRDRERALTNLEAVAESVRELVWQRDRAGHLTFLTGRVEDIYGLDRSHVLADPGLLTAAIHPADRERVAVAAASTDRLRRAEYRIVRPDGSIRWVEERVDASDDTAPRITGSVLDVTDRRALRTAAAQRAAVIDAVLAARGLGVLVLDGEDRILQVSASFSHIIGYEPTALVGTPLDVLVLPDPGATPPVESAGRDDLEAGRILAADGTYRPVTLERIPVESAGDGKDRPTGIAVVHDVSRLREISADLATREQFDQQTGLLTRAYFRYRTDELVTRGIAGIAVLWIDLDGFKEVNDRFGHRSGDAVLATIAHRLRSAARHHDVIGRLGGDEFAVLATRVGDLDGLESVVHRIQSSIREPLDIDGTLVYLSASIGIAVHPDDGRNSQELLHNADTAMYAAKASGRDRHAYFASAMNSGAEERAQNRAALAAAVRTNAFELHYQPVLNLTSGRVTHVEALLRWRRADEIVPAREFIKHAADSGQLHAIGRIALQLVDADITAMHHRLGVHRPRVSINLSGIELEDRDTVDRLLTWDPAGGFDRVIIEVTEDVLLVTDRRVLDTLAVLRRLGAWLAIDGFGSGTSNPKLLRRLSPEIIKIDRSLLEHADRDAQAANILAATIDLARAITPNVVVKGVADQATADIVRDLGSEYAQGNLLAAPLALPDLIDWITTHSDRFEHTD